MKHITSYKIQQVPFSAWLYKIAYTETMYYFRKTKRCRTVVLDDKLIEGLEEDLVEFSKEKVLRKIEFMLTNLKPDDFELIELRFYQGKSFNEIGFILGCTENSAKVKAHRLIKKMRIEMGTSMNSNQNG
jgi:RNA polymerase sigma-70 factor (ECF subfamily)